MLTALSCMTVWYAVLFPDRFKFAPCSCHRIALGTTLVLAVHIDYLNCKQYQECHHQEQDDDESEDDLYRRVHVNLITASRLPACCYVTPIGRP